MIRGQGLPHLENGAKGGADGWDNEWLELTQGVDRTRMSIKLSGDIHAQAR